MASKHSPKHFSTFLFPFRKFRFIMGNRENHNHGYCQKSNKESGAEESRRRTEEGRRAQESRCCTEESRRRAEESCCCTEESRRCSEACCRCSKGCCCSEAGCRCSEEGCCKESRSEESRCKESCSEKGCCQEGISSVRSFTRARFGGPFLLPATLLSSLKITSPFAATSGSLPAFWSPEYGLFGSFPSIPSS